MMNVNLKNLKKSGICYDGTITNIYPKPLIKIGSYITASVECIYQIGKNYETIKSNHFVLLPFDTKKNLSAKIYFSNSDIKDFVIELYRIEN